MAAPRLPDPEPVPEPEAETAVRQASEIRRRRARGGRARTILSNGRAQLEGGGDAGGRSAGAFVSGLGGARGRRALIN